MGDYQREIGKKDCGNFDDFVNMMKRVETESNIEEIDQERDRSPSAKFRRDKERYHPYERTLYRESYRNRRVQRDASRTPPRVMQSRRGGGQVYSTK